MTIFRIEGSSSYEYVAGSYTYDQALAGAAAAGGWLLTIESAAENASVRSWLDGITGSATWRTTWMAISDAVVEGDWKYTAGPSSGIFVPYFNWYPGNPDNGGNGGDEDYAIFSIADGKWHDLTGVNTAFMAQPSVGYVIERSAGLVGTSGADTLIGGPGSDTADYGGAGDAIHVRTTTTLSLGALPASAQLAGVGFTDVTTSAGVLVAGSTRASAWGDHDGDGDLDLFVVDQGGGYFLFSNAGDGTFIDATTAAGISGVAYSNAAAWGDYDGDGDLDLFVATGHGDPDVLYRNDGNGRFANVADAAGLRGSTVAYSASGAAWGDYDGDLDLDLHVVNHAGEDILYRNDGTGTFTNVSLSAAIVDTGAGAQSSWIDYDDDGDLDLYVTTIYGGPNVLYRNEGNGVFVNVTAAAGVVGQGETTGIAWGDYDGDGDFDLYAPNTEGTGVLYRNEGDGHFVDVTLAAGVPGAAMAGGGGTSAAWGDFDADGDLDLYVANYYAPNILYLNDGDGTFTDATAAYSVGDVGLSHSIALGDYDGDGDLDIHVASHGSTDPNVLYRNNANPSGATMLRVDSRVEGAPAIAATLRLMLGDTVVATRLSGHSDGFGQSLGPVSFFALDPDESYTLRTTYSDGVTLDTVLGTPTERAGRLLTVDRVRLATGADIGTDTLRGIEHVVGGAGDDMLVGTRAGDTLAGGIGDDTLSGGDGVDMAAYALARANYSLLNVGSGTIAVMALAGSEGLDTVLGVETLRFADGDVSVAGLPIGDAGAVSVAGVMALRAAGFQGPWSYAVSDSAEVLLAPENTQVVAGASAVVVEGVASVLQAAAIVSASAPGTDVDYVIFDDVPSILAIGGFAALPGFPLPANRSLLVDAIDVRIADGQVLDGGTAANLASVGVSLAASTAFLGIHGDGDSLAVGQIRDYLSMIAGFGTSLGAVRYGVRDSASTIVDPANLDVIRGANKLVVTGRATVQEVQAINAIATSAVSISYDASAEASGVTIALGDGASVVAQADGASIVGSAFGDTLFGGSGDDVMEGGGGDDTLSGGDGADIATYALLRASYDISRDASGVLTVRALSGSEGTDTLTGIETLRFSDGDFLASSVAMPGTYFSGSIAVSPALGSGDNVVSSNYLQVGLNAPGSLQVVGKSLQVNTSRGGAVDIGRSNNGLASEGSLALQNGASLQISGIPSVPSPSAFVYMNANMQVGRNVNGIGDMEVSGAGTSLSMSGYGAFVEVGRESGVGNVTISAGAHVAIEGHRQLVAGNLVADENFASVAQLVIARNTGGSTSAASVGNVEITGTGTSLAISADAGADIAIGRANGGGRIANGTLTISGGADVLLSSDATAEGADSFSASSLTVGRGIGGEGHAVITGPGTSFVAEGHVARINIARPDNALYYEILGSGRGTLVIDGGASVVLRATPDPDKVTGEKSVAGNVVSGALDFDGAGSRVEIADPGASRLDVSSGMTLELFLEGKPYDVTGSSMTLASKGAAWSVVLDTRGTASLSDDVLVFSAGSGTGATLSVAAGQFFDGFAHSAAMAYDGTARTFRVLRDGAQVASQSGITGGAIASNDDPILIGGTGSTGFSGTIDEVRLWSKARSNDAINAYWLNDVATSVERSAYLVGHWKFDEASGTTVLDSSGNGFSGVVHGAAARTAIGRWDDDGGDDSYANIVVGRGKSADGDLSIAGAGTQVELSGHQASLTIGTMGGAGSATVSGGAVLSLASTPSALMPDYWSGTVVDVGRARGYLDGVASQGEFTIQGAGTRVELTGHQASFHVGRERKDLVLDLDGGTGTLVVEAGAQLRLDAQGAADRIDPANPDHWSGSQLVIGRGANGSGSATIRGAGTTVTLEGHEVHVWVGDEGGTGTLQLDTGATLVMDAVAEAGRAASRTGAWMVVGDGAGSTGGLSLDGVGTRLSIHGAASLLAIGVAGDGEVVVSGGATIGLDASGVVALAGATGSSARLEITGDGSSLSAGTLVAGMRFEDAPVAFDRSLAVASGGAAEISLSGGGELRVAESWLLANARLGGEGRLVGDLSNLGGEVGPGAGIGSLVVDGDYLQEGSGILRLDLSASANDLLEVTGAARFEDGVIDLDYASLAGIDPAHRFVLARATGGIFLSASVEIRDLPTGYALRVEDGGSTLVLALDPPLELLPLSVADGIATFEVVLKGGYTIDAADLVLHVDPAAGTFQGFDAPGADLADADATTGGDLSAGMAWLEPVGGADPARLATVAYTLAGGARSLELSMVSGILGFVSGGAGTEIMPAAAASVILGTDGDDTLASAAGNDLVDGGAGAADWVSYAGAAAPVIVALASGSAQGGAGKDILVGIENVAGGAFADTLAGDAGANQLSGAGGDDTLAGGAGNDVLSGDAGSDRLEGGLGDDTYVIGDALDTVVEATSEGVDEIRTSLSALVLASEVEDLAFDNGAAADIAFTGTGNELANVVTGGTAGDTLSGAGGDDTLRGGAGDDTLVGGTGDDTLAGGQGSDTADYSNSAAPLVLRPGEMVLVGAELSPRSGLGGVFTDISTISGLGEATGGHAAAWGDYDGDGRLDLRVLNHMAPDLLYVSDGNGAFVRHILPAAGVATGDGVFSSWAAHGVEDEYSVAWGDYDGDGDLDQYIPRHSAPNSLLKNEGGGIFIDVASLAGVDLSNRDSRGAQWIDYDADGDLDLYVTQHLTGNVLFRNDGSGLFSDVTVSSGALGNGYGATWGDYDNDNNIDLYVVNYEGSNILYRSNGNGTFSDVTITAGLFNADSLYDFDAAWLDYDGDGNLDIYVTGSNILYRNVGDGTFIDVTESSGAGVRGSHGLAWSDYDFDGDADLFVTDFLGQNVFYRNDAEIESGSFVRVDLRAGGLPVIDATLRLVADGNVLATRLVSAAKSYAQSIAPVSFYGLDPNQNYSLRVTFSDGDTMEVSLGTPSASQGRLLTVDRLGGDRISGPDIGFDLLDGIERVVGGSGNDTLSGGAGDETLLGGAGDDTLLGGDGIDTLSGGDGNDVLDGGAGIDVLAGGAGDDIYIVAWEGSNVDAVNEEADAGTDTVRTASSNYSLEGPANVENLAYTGTGNFTGTGNALANVVTGGTGNDTLSGLAGNDTLIGGAGDDTLAGGDGSDVATYALARSSYGVSRDAFGTIVVEALSGAEGIDTLSGVERLRFADGDMIDFAAPTLAANGVTVSENGTTVTLVFDEDLSPVGAAWSAFTVTVNGVAALVASASVSGNTVTLTMARPIAQGTTVTVGYVDPAGDQASGVLQDVAGNDAAACSNVPATNNSIVDPSATLSGIAYHWKSHALLGSVSVVARGDGTGDGGPSPLSLRGHRFDANGDLVAEVWMDGGAGVENAGFELSSDGGAALSWTASEPSGWMVDTANEAGVLRVAMIGSTTVSGAVKLGTVVLDLPTGAEREVIRLLDGEVGAAQVAGFATTVARGPTDGQGAYAVVELDHDGYYLSASRTTTDTGSAITSSDALAALKLAVGRNPNTDPDGSGPLVAPLVSPYQFIAADVTGDGRVTSSDALGILKMAVRRADAPARDWFMVREDADFWDEAAGKFTTTRTSVAWSRETQVDLQQDLAVNFVGVLKGDVNGSWKPLDAAGRPMADGTFAALSHAYFEDLARLTGAPIDQWGG